MIFGKIFVSFLGFPGAEGGTIILKKGGNMKMGPKFELYAFHLGLDVYQKKKLLEENKVTKKSQGKDKQVIQGSHMVSGTRCPTWSD